MVTDIVHACHVFDLPEIAELHEDLLKELLEMLLRLIGYLVRHVLALCHCDCSRGLLVHMWDQ